MRHHLLIAALVMLGAVLSPAAPALHPSLRPSSTPATTAAVATTAAPTTIGALTSVKPFATTQPALTGPAAVVVLKGEVDDYSRDAVIKRFNQAKASGAKTIILVLNTPGGLVMAAMDITHFLR